MFTNVYTIKNSYSMKTKKIEILKKKKNHSFNFDSNSLFCLSNSLIFDSMLSGNA